MVALDLVLKSNSQLRELGPGLVALFVGATSGIGEATLKAYIKHTQSPTAYIVGRNETAASRIITECAALNQDSKVSFIKADVSELSEVDRVCQVVVEKERHLNLLVQSQGNLNTRGRDESPEALDRKLCLNYYSRARFIHNLLPLLRTSTTTSPHLSRALSILGAGHEGKISLADLGLQKTYSIARCANHSIVMTDFLLERLAAHEPGIAFVHSHPALVETGIARELPLWARLGLRLLGPALKAVAVPVGETGERQLFIATSPMFPPAAPTSRNGEGDAPETAIIGTTESGTGVRREVVPIATGIDGKVGSGAYLVEWNGEVTGKMSLLEKYRQEGAPQAIWEHTMEVFERVRPAGSGVGSSS